MFGEDDVLRLGVDVSQADLRLQMLSAIHSELFNLGIAVLTIELSVVPFAIP